jgi:hypothetical protein
VTPLSSDLTPPASRVNKITHDNGKEFAYHKAIDQHKLGKLTLLIPLRVGSVDRMKITTAC